MFEDIVFSIHHFRKTWKRERSLMDFRTKTLYITCAAAYAPAVIIGTPIVKLVEKINDTITDIAVNPGRTR